VSWGINLVLAAFWLAGVFAIALLIRLIVAWRDYRRERDSAPR
jgi:membrane protein implicated in regulation of membrane protease activity